MAGTDQGSIRNAGAVSVRQHSGVQSEWRQRPGFALALSLSLSLHLALLSWPFLPGQRLTDTTRTSHGGNLTATLSRSSLPPTDELLSQNLAESIATAADSAAPGTVGSAPKEGIRVRKDIYEIDEVDVRPWIKSRIKPEYPPMLPLGIEASTILRFVVDEEGSVTELEVERAAPDPLFDQFAIRAFAKAVYSQALVNRQAVKVRMRVEIYFNSP